MLLWEIALSAFVCCSIRSKHLSLPVPEGEDDDVLKERASVLQDRDTSDDLLVLRNLTKIYGTRCSSQYRMAVNQLCLRVEKGEVSHAEEG